MTDTELQAIREQNGRYSTYTMHSNCDDYACPCHFAVPKLLAEIERLKAIIEARENTSWEKSERD